MLDVTVVEDDELLLDYTVYDVSNDMGNVIVTGAFCDFINEQDLFDETNFYHIVEPQIITTY